MTVPQTPPATPAEPATDSETPPTTTPVTGSLDEKISKLQDMVEKLSHRPRTPTPTTNSRDVEEAARLQVEQAAKDAHLTDLEATVKKLETKVAEVQPVEKKTFLQRLFGFNE